MDIESYRAISFLGFFAICCLAWVTGRCRTLNFKTIIGSLLFAWVLGFLVFGIPGSQTFLLVLNEGVLTLLKASQKGTLFLFGPLALGPGQSLPDGTASIGFVLAMQVLPSVIFFSALLSALYYLNIMPWVIRGFAVVFYKVMRLSGAEALSASANIFVGIESSLTVRPYLSKLTSSELLTLLTCMMATVASTVLGIYVIALQSTFPQIAAHLISASIISIPCAILISKLSLPETEKPETMKMLPQDSSEEISQEKNEVSSSNLMVALMNGGAQGVKMAVGIGTLLIVVLGLESLIDLILGKIFFIDGDPLSLGKLLGWLTWPFTALLGLQPNEWLAASKILGSRFIETEVTAYFNLAAVQENTPPVFSQRSLVIITYALCGFVHVASVGIFVGGLAPLMPTRLKELSLLGMRSLWTAFLATLLTGCIAGVLA